MTKMGASIGAMRERIRASLSWSDVIRRKFGHQITVANRDVDRMVASCRGPGRRRAAASTASCSSLPPNQDQKRLAQRINDAEQLRGKFTGCKSMETMARGVPGARFDNLGDRRPTQLARTDAQPLAQRARRRAAARHHRRERRRAVGRVRTQAGQGGGFEARDGAERAAPERVRDPLQEASEGSAYGRPHRVSADGRGGRSVAGASRSRVSMGDPAGIGPEITLRAWLERSDKGLDPFLVFADQDVLAERARHLGLAVPIAARQRAGRSRWRLSEADCPCCTALLPRACEPGSAIPPTQRRDRGDRGGDGGRRARRSRRHRDQSDRQVRAQERRLPISRPYGVSRRPRRAPFHRQALPAGDDARLARAARRAPHRALRPRRGAEGDHPGADLRDGAHDLCGAETRFRHRQPAHRHRRAQPARRRGGHHGNGGDRDDRAGDCRPARRGAVGHRAAFGRHAVPRRGAARL